MSLRSISQTLACAGALPFFIGAAAAQVQVWAPGMPAPIELNETNRSAAASLVKPFRYDVFGVAGKLELGNKANSATVVGNTFKEKFLLFTGGTVQSSTYVVLQTGLTNVYPENISVSGISPGVSVGPLHRYGPNWTLSDPMARKNVNLSFHMAGSSLLGSLLPGLLSPAYYNLNPKGYFYVLGEYHQAPPVMSGNLGVTSDEVITGASVNVSFQITRYDTPIYRPPFLGLDLASVGLTVIGSPPQTTAATPAPGPADNIATGGSNELFVTVDLSGTQGRGWLRIANTP